MKSETADTSRTGHEPCAVYEIEVEGELDPSWEGWFNGLAVCIESPPGGRAPATTLRGSVADQAALRGLLCGLWDLNLSVVSVRRVDQGKEGRSG